MQVLEIVGDRRLSGETEIQGAKNAVLPILAATLLGDGECVIHNCPNLSDVKTGLEILKGLGAECHYNADEKTAYICCDNASECIISEKLMCEMRSSVMFLGAILARCKKARICYPGGCELGPRPIDIHLKAFRELGVKIEEYSGFIYCELEKYNPSVINLQIPSVGATENIMLLCAGLKGETVIENAACEPEIMDLQNFLRKMGADICGAGTSKIIIRGTDKLKGTEYKVIPDRIVATTYLCAAAACGGDILIKNAESAHLMPQLSLFKESGCKITASENEVRLRCKARPLALRMIKTSPYPGFPTDAQAIFMSLMSLAEGTTVFVENIFESRYKHITELIKMGADITAEGRVAVVRGCDLLQGARVTAADLRGGAALAVAGLSAFDKTVVCGIEHIERGYEDIGRDLSALGGNIKKTDIF